MFKKRFQNLKKFKLKKGRKNLHEVLGKFYFKFYKIINKICEILKQILKRLEILKIVSWAQYKIKTEEVTDD